MFKDVLEKKVLLLKPPDVTVKLHLRQSHNRESHPVGSAH